MVPPGFLAALVVQARAPGRDRPRRAPLLRWFRVAVGVQAATMGGVGAALLIAPVSTAGVWPWALTPLTGRATGAWTFALALAGHW